MNKFIKHIENIVSKIGHPSPVVAIANRLLENQEVKGYRKASIGRNCELRGRIELGDGSTIGNDCKLRNEVKLGDNSSVFEGCKLQGHIRVGEGTNLGRNTEVIGDVEFGKYCAVARNVVFQERNHQVHKPAMQMEFYRSVLDSELEHVSKGPITVGNDVWIGTRAIILSGVSIGDGAIVGAGSIVTDDVEPYAVVAGAPAERVKWRFPEETREKLLDLSWWDWDTDKIRENKEFFNSEVKSPDGIESLVD